MAGKRRRLAAIAALAALASVALLATMSSSAGADNVPMLTAPQVLVNKTGGVTAMGKVDCSARVLQKWGTYEDAPDIVLTNVDWTVNQAQGRKMITVTFGDGMGSPCWAKQGAADVDPGRCVLDADGTLHPCTWDSYNYGSDGWIYGNGAVKPGAVHLSATMDGGYWFDDSDPQHPVLRNEGWFEMDGWDLRATRG